MLELQDNRLRDLKGITGLRGLQARAGAASRSGRLEGLMEPRPSLQAINLSGNRLESLQGFQGLPALQSLRASSIGLRKVDGLSNLPLLSELSLRDNGLMSLLGLPALPRLRELDAGDNQLTSLQGVKPVAASLDTLTVDGNRLASLESSLAVMELPLLTELNAAGNLLTSLGSLGAKCPRLEVLDLSDNRLADLPAVLASLGGLTDLAELRLAGNPVAREPGYRAAVCAALPSLQVLDDAEVGPEERGAFGTRQQGQQEADVFSLEAATAEDPEAARELHEYMGRLGIRSLPSPTRAAPARPPTASGGRGRPGTASGRPSTAAALGAVAPGKVLDPMMHARSLSERTGAGGRVLRATEFEETRQGFVAAMDSYRDQLTRLLGELRRDLGRDPHEAAEDLRKRGASAGHVPTLTSAMPQLPAMGLVSQAEAVPGLGLAPSVRQKGPGAAGAQHPRQQGVSELEIPVVGSRPPTASRRPGSAAGLASVASGPAPSSGVAKPAAASPSFQRMQEALLDRTAGREALEMFERLFPPAGQQPQGRPLSSGSTSSSTDTPPVGPEESFDREEDEEGDADLGSLAASPFQPQEMQARWVAPGAAPRSTACSNASVSPAEHPLRPSLVASTPGSLLRCWRWAFSRTRSRERRAKRGSTSGESGRQAPPAPEAPGSLRRCRPCPGLPRGT